MARAGISLNLNGFDDLFEKIKKALPKSVIKKTKNILIIGCGTAYHAGLIGKRIIVPINNII